MDEDATPKDLHLKVFADADWAGDSDSGRSTTGGFACVFGPKVFWPLAFKTAKQTCTSTSTPEAELVAANTVLKALGIPLLDLLEELVGDPVSLDFEEDNETCITAIRAGQSPTMRHLKRCHNVSLKWLHDVLTQNKQMNINKCASADMTADIFTKPFGDKKRSTWNILLKL